MLKPNIVGRFDTKNTKLTNLNEHLTTSSYKIVNLEVEAYDICILPNGLLALSHKGLTVYNDNFTTVLTTNQLNGKAIESLTFTTNNIDRIYINDFSSHEIMMTDLNFNYMKSTAGTNYLHYPCGVHYANHAVYVCDFVQEAYSKVQRRS